MFHQNLLSRYGDDCDDVYPQITQMPMRLHPQQLYGRGTIWAKAKGSAKVNYVMYIMWCSIEIEAYTDVAVIRMENGGAASATTQAASDGQVLPGI